MKKRIAVLGATGSIGTQTLAVIREQAARFQVEVLTAHENYQLLIEQSIEFQPNAVVIGDARYYPPLADALQGRGIKVYAGQQAINQVVEMESIDLVVVALVGFAGLQPTLNAISHGKPVALANKETLVVAGELVTRLARAKGVNIFPIDSEHSAIFQCLAGEDERAIEKLILTASGGPFRTWGREQLLGATPEQALNHPNWKMGCKVTVDSASMMNKGLEVIEAYWLFGLPSSQIDIVLHPQSIIHSMVQFRDGSVKAQLGLPDMRLPIMYALAFPARLSSSFPRYDFSQPSALTFEPPDYHNFKNLSLAYRSLERGGNIPCVLNAANEIAVEAFLNHSLGFVQMSDLIEQCMEVVPYIAAPVLDDYLRSDEEARRLARTLIKDTYGNTR